MKYATTYDIVIAYMDFSLKVSKFYNLNDSILYEWRQSYLIQLPDLYKPNDLIYLCQI